MNCYTIDNYTMKCYKNNDNKIDEEYGYFCDIEGDKTYYMNDNQTQYYPIPKKNNYKIIVQSLPTIEEDLEKCDIFTEQKHYDNSINSNIYINDDKIKVIIRVLFYIVCCIMLLS